MFLNIINGSGRVATLVMSVLVRIPIHVFLTVFFFENRKQITRALPRGFDNLWLVSRKSRKRFGPGKPFLKLRLAHSVKLVFSCVVKGRKVRITAKFRAFRRFRFEDTKRPMSPESFGTFEKRATGGQAVPVDGSTQPKFGICERSSVSLSSKRIPYPHFIHGR